MAGPEVITDSIEARLRDLGDFIREQRHRDRLSLRKLSELAGISNPYLSQIERGLRKPSVEILQAIARGLRISAETLYVRAGILEERNDTDLVPHILCDTTINERHKQTLIEVYRSFQRESAAEPDTHSTSGTNGPSNPGTEPDTESNGASGGVRAVAGGGAPRLAGQE